MSILTSLTLVDHAFKELANHCTIDVRNEHGEIIEVNQSLLDFYGIDRLLPEDQLNNQLQNLINFTDIQKTLTEGNGWIKEVSMSHLPQRWVQLYITKITCPKTEALLFVSIHTDVTEVKNNRIVEAKYQKKLNELTFALNHTAIIATTDKTGKIIEVNDHFCKLSKYDRSELIGQTHSIINSGHHPRSFFTDLWRTISKGLVWKNEIKNKDKLGGYYWVDTTIIPLMDSNGDIEKYFSIRQNVTERVEATQKIQVERSKAIYADKMAVLGEMSANIAHEIGNPLSAMMGRLEMLNEQLDQPGTIDPLQLKPTITKLISMSERISNTIRSLRSYSRDGSNDAKQPTNLNQMVLDVLDICSEKCRRSNIERIQTELKPNVTATCRESEIGQVLINLIGNACDAVKDLDERWIKIQLFSDRNIATIVITDSGSNLTPQLQKQIFKAHFTTKEVGKGTGLGLSISKNIIEAHQGTLEIDSDSKNTSFVIRLPKNSR